MKHIKTLKVKAFYFLLLFFDRDLALKIVNLMFEFKLGLFLGRSSLKGKRINWKYQVKSYENETLLKISGHIMW